LRELKFSGGRLDFMHASCRPVGQRSILPEFDELLSTGESYLPKAISWTGEWQSFLYRLKKKAGL
jgi:hypothetical protein